MKAISLTGLILTTVIALAGCSSTSPSPDQTPKSEVRELLSERWIPGNTSAATIASDLVEAGICKHVGIESDGVYGTGDALTNYLNGSHRQCTNWTPAENPEPMKCAVVFYIATGDAAEFNPQRPLSYEDGSSIALFYSDSYQIEFASRKSGMEDGAKLVADCAEVVAQMKQQVGGNVTMYGDYDYADQQETAPEELPRVETVSMPNLVGSLDGVAEDWLFSNSYKFTTQVKSTGFNAKISCMMSGKNVVLDQNPRAGTIVENSPSTLVYLIVNCEW